MVEGLSVILAHYQRGSNAEVDDIVKNMQWWGEIYDVFHAGFPMDARAQVLQVAAALPIPPDVVATCDRMGATLEELIALLAVAVSMPPAQSHAVTLPDNLI